MKQKYEELLLSELIAIYAYDLENENVKNEIVNRLIFCGFDEKTIMLIIECEVKIIKKRKLKNMPHLCNSYIWLDSNNKLVGKRKLFNRPKEFYYVYPDRPVLETSLTLSELMWIYDEAFYIANIGKKNSEVIMSEVREISCHEDSRSWVVGEFYSRIESIYRYANNINKEYKGIIIDNNISCLYDNELNIIFNEKWRKKLGLRKKYKSYTQEYYLYKTNQEGGQK